MKFTKTDVNALFSAFANAIGRAIDGSEGALGLVNVEGKWLIEETKKDGSAYPYGNVPLDTNTFCHALNFFMNVNSKG